MLTKKLRSISMVCLAFVMALSLCFGIANFSNVKSASADTATLSSADFSIVDQKGNSAQDWLVNSTYTSKIGTSTQAYNGITKIEWSFSSLGSSNAGKFHYNVYVNDTSVFSYTYDSSNKIVANTKYDATVNNLSGNVKFEIIKRDNTSPVLGNVIVTYSSNAGGNEGGSGESGGEVTEPEDPNPNPGEGEEEIVGISTTSTINLANDSLSAGNSKSLKIADGVYFLRTGSTQTANSTRGMELKTNNIFIIKLNVPAFIEFNFVGSGSGKKYETTLYSITEQEYSNVVAGLSSLPSYTTSVASFKNDVDTTGVTELYRSSNSGYYALRTNSASGAYLKEIKITVDPVGYTFVGYNVDGAMGSEGTVEQAVFAKAEYLGVQFKTAGNGAIRFGFMISAVNAGDEAVALSADLLSDATFTFVNLSNGKSANLVPTTLAVGSDETNLYTNLAITGMDAAKSANVLTANLSIKVNGVAIEVNGSETESITAKAQKALEAGQLNEDQAGVYGA